MENYQKTRMELLKRYRRCELCGDDRGLHKTLERVTNKDGRRGWKDNPRIPQVHVYNINGYIEHLEGGNRNYENSKH